jgi:hypothetical protein
MGGRLGQALVKTGYLTKGQLGVALEAQRTCRAPLADVLVALGFIPSIAVVAAVVKAC